MQSRSLTETKDKITICVYFKEEDNVSGVLLDKINQEMERAKGIAGEFRRQAKENHRDIDIAVSVLVLPKAARSSDYDNTNYQEIKEAIFEQIKSELDEHEIEPHDFYLSLDEKEKEYLAHLSGGGNYLDFMKIKAVISNSNCRHLQLDSNTIITNYKNFYLQTFAAPIQEMALNACLYGKSKIMPHSKIIYTIPGCGFVKFLRDNYDAEILMISDANETKEMHLYMKIFVKALKDLRLANPIVPGSNEWVTLYRITSNVLSMTQQTWKDAQSKSIKPKLPELEINNIFCNENLIKSLVKNYSTDISNRDALLSISNQVLEYQILRTYFQSCNTEQKKQIIEMIPEKGDAPDNFIKQLLENPNASMSEVRLEYGIKSHADEFRKGVLFRSRNYLPKNGENIENDENNRNNSMPPTNTKPRKP